MLLRFDVSVFSILASAARQTARGSISTMSGRLPGEIPRRRPSSDSAMFGRRVALLYTEHALPRARLDISNLSRWPGNRRVESSATRMKPRLHAAPHGAGVPRSSDRRWLRATHLETNPCRVPRRSVRIRNRRCRHVPAERFEDRMCRAIEDDGSGRRFWRRSEPDRSTPRPESPPRFRPRSRSAEGVRDRVADSGRLDFRGGVRFAPAKATQGRGGDGEAGRAGAAPRLAAGRRIRGGSRRSPGPKAPAGPASCVSPNSGREQFIRAIQRLPGQTTIRERSQRRDTLVGRRSVD